MMSEELIKLGLAVLVGGVIGLEREYRDKSAGFRTMIFITLGSTLFTMLSLEFVGDSPARVAANIVTGIGFLGAGAIMRESGKVAGLTTASTIWLASSMGMGIGLGQYAFVLIATALTLVVLILFPAVEHWLGKVHDVRMYTIIVRLEAAPEFFIDRVLEQYRIGLVTKSLSKGSDRLIITVRTAGQTSQHARFINGLMNNKNVIEFRY
jgi:putative Mg2+ transporter-C (MgtC) family protein